MLCLADGEPVLEDALRDAFPTPCSPTTSPTPRTTSTPAASPWGWNSPPQSKEYRFCRGLLYRIGAESAVRRLRRLYRKPLDAAPPALKDLLYLEKRKDNMRCGWFRKNGYCIGSGHVKAAVRVLFMRRCKQAGMHWRHANAVSMAAIHARYSSHHKAA